MPGFNTGMLVVVGAYGRDANEQDWVDGKDFKIKGGPYFSIRDCGEIKMQGTEQIVFLNNRGFVAFTWDF